jgi:prevent-host-death family protein
LAGSRLNASGSKRTLEYSTRKAAQVDAEFNSIALTKELLEATFLIMRTVGLKTLKNKLSEYVRAAASGETVQVTDRGRVVAEIIPPSAASHPFGANPELADAVRRGWITLSPLTGGVPPASPTMAFEGLMDDLRQARADR